MDDTTVGRLLEHLKHLGYVSEGIEEADKLTINLPRTDFADSQYENSTSVGNPKNSASRRMQKRIKAYP